MNAKDYLLEIRKLKRRCETLSRKCEELRTQAAGLKAITYDRDRVQTSPTNQLEIAMLRLADLEHKYTESVAKYHAIIQIRERQIKQLDNPLFVEVLSLRYIDELPIKDVAIAIQRQHPDKIYREDYIRHVHGWALKAFEEKFLNKFQK